MTDLRIFTPADVLDMALLGRANQPVLWDVAREMRTGGDSWAMREDGETIVIAGLYPIGNGAAEAWFSCSPKAAPHMATFIRHARLTMRASGYREIVTVARTRAGRILTRRLGFRFVQETAFGDLMRCHFSAETTER